MREPSKKSAWLQAIAIVIAVYSCVLLVVFAREHAPTLSIELVLDFVLVLVTPLLALPGALLAFAFPQGVHNEMAFAVGMSVNFALHVWVVRYFLLKRRKKKLDTSSTSQP